LSSHTIVAFPEEVPQSQTLASNYQPVNHLFNQKEILSKRQIRHKSTERSQTETLRSDVQLADIAIIGMSGRFPGADNLTTFWHNLATGHNAITDTSSRWPTADFFHPDPLTPGKSYSKWAGLLANIDRFDPLFFNLSPREAELTDPQQRLFLQEAWAALEDAGYAPPSLTGQKC